MTPQQEELDHLATQNFRALEQSRNVLVLAESCTAGLIAATLARIPGMSRRLAGSFVVYQIPSKVAWLGIPAEMIQEHDVVSREVAETMALQALARTPHATIALSITGHLGPEAPPERDGVAWLATVSRRSAPIAVQLQLTTGAVDNATELRHQRQTDAVRQALTRLSRILLLDPH